MREAGVNLSHLLTAWTLSKKDIRDFYPYLEKHGSNIGWTERVFSQERNQIQYYEERFQTISCQQWKLAARCQELLEKTERQALIEKIKVSNQECEERLQVFLLVSFLRFFQVVQQVSVRKRWLRRIKERYKGRVTSETFVYNSLRLYSWKVVNRWIHLRNWEHCARGGRIV